MLYSPSQSLHYVCAKIFFSLILDIVLSGVKVEATEAPSSQYFGAIAVVLFCIPLILAFAMDIAILHDTYNILLKNLGIRSTSSYLSTANDL